MKALVHTKPYTMEFKDVPKPKKNQNQVLIDSLCLLHRIQSIHFLENILIHNNQYLLSNPRKITKK